MNLTNTIQRVTFALALISAPVFARGGGEARGERLAEQLNLSADQAKQIQALRKDEKVDMKQKRIALRQQREKLKEMLASDASESDVRQAFQGIQSAQKDLAQEQFDKMLAIRKLLTPEQRKKFAEIHHKRRGD